MYFTGEASRKRVDLSGRSKQQDRQKLLEQARVDRDKRQRVRLENQSAVKIQKVFRGRRTAARLRNSVRSEWQRVYGENGENAVALRGSVLRVESSYLPQLLFFARALAESDVRRLAGACQLLLQAFHASPEDSAAAFVDAARYAEARPIVEHRVRQLALLCLNALHKHRLALQSELNCSWRPQSATSGFAESLPGGVAGVLMDATLSLVSRGPWAPSVLAFLAQQRLFVALRSLLMTVVYPPSTSPLKVWRGTGEVSVVEQFALLVSIQHLSGPQPPSAQLQPSDAELRLPMQLRFAIQIGSIPLLWQNFPSFNKAVAAGTGLWRHMVHSLGSSPGEIMPALPADADPAFPTRVCLLGNLLSAGGAGLTHPACGPPTVGQFSEVSQRLLDELPCYEFCGTNPESLDVGGGANAGGAEESEELEALQQQRASTPPPDLDLEHQLAKVGDPEMLKHMVRLALPSTGAAASSLGTTWDGDATPGAGREADAGASASGDVPVVTSLCAFLHAARMVMPRQSFRMVAALALGADLVPRLWRYMKACHQVSLSLSLSVSMSASVSMPPPPVAASWRHMWPSSGRTRSTETDSEALSWLLPLAVFCPVYSYLLATTDNEEFYDASGPVPLPDCTLLVQILREAVWQLLWVEKAKPVSPVLPLLRPALPAAAGPGAAATGGRTQSPLSIDMLKRHVSREAAKLIAELHNRNSKRQFAAPREFHARQAVEESFFAQAEGEKGRAHELLKEAPFLVPFADRVRIYTIQAQSSAFLKGFQTLIEPELLAMFNEQELQMLISGSQEGMELSDLQQHATYSGGYHQDHPSIRLLWEVLQGFNSDMLHKFLKFVTGCSRGPLLGFRYLEPHFCIHRAAPEAADAESLDRLPTSATCMNLLKLPPYKSKETLEEKLMYAITAGAGFDLS
eukprot:jgi/Mesen1/1380/ME000013S00873